MYDHQLRVHGEHLASAQTLPKNTKVVGNGDAKRAGSMLGAVEIVMKAATDVTLAASKSISLYLEESDSQENFEATTVYFKIASGVAGRKWQKGDVIGRLPLPSNSKRFIRAVIQTDDTVASGQVDVIFDYMPR